ncbi:MAG TPA: YciI family protein [Bacteroidia bacterium]|nr:YciI family protein [Bacteroidia bacterium]
MKAVIIGESAGATMETIMSVYPRHKVVVDKYVAKGDVIGIGPLGDGGNMAIFKTRQAAEEFIKEDPFLPEGIVKSYTIRDWKDTML